MLTALMNQVHKFLAILTCVLGIVIILPSNFIGEIAQSFPFIGLRGLDQNLVMYLDSFDSKSLASSVSCTKRLDNSKLCKFKNLYYFPEYKDTLLFLLNGHSVVIGLKSVNNFKVINLSTVKNHTGLNLKLVIIKSKEHILNKTVKILGNHYFLMKRFKPDNIMHVIHDDLLPLFSTYQEICVGDVQHCLSKYNLIFLDNNEEGPFFEWYKYFSNHKPTILARETIAVCIVNSIVGLSHRSIWYQYGFKSKHGQFLNSQVDGLVLSQFTNFLNYKLSVVKSKGNQGIKKPFNESLTTAVFLSRKINRKILFESAIENEMKKIYNKLNKKPLQILTLDLSCNSSVELITAIQKSRYLIGIHGSAMMLAIFLPPGSTIIEVFPFGIQPFFVSPLKSLCTRPNMFYRYLSWVNQNESNTRTHPEYPPLHGGISHLPVSKQQEIINTKLVPPVECCHNPLYLFRMFQDTIVDDSFYRLVSDVFGSADATVVGNQEVYDARMQDSSVRIWYFPPPVFNISCDCVENKLKIMWNFPFEILANVSFSVATEMGIYIVSDQTTITLEEEGCNNKIKKAGDSPNLFKISVWIKTLEDKKESIDSYFQCSIL